MNALLDPRMTFFAALVALGLAIAALVVAVKADKDKDKKENYADMGEQYLRKILTPNNVDVTCDAAKSIISNVCSAAHSSVNSACSAAGKIVSQ